MGTQYLKDARGNKIAAITENAGQTTLFDMTSKRLGVYNHAMDLTFDARGNRIGRGDMLLTLLIR